MCYFQPPKDIHFFAQWRAVLAALLTGWNKTSFLIGLVPCEQNVSEHWIAVIKHFRRIDLAVLP